MSLDRSHGTKDAGQQRNDHPEPQLGTCDVPTLCLSASLCCDGWELSVMAGWVPVDILPSLGGILLVYSSVLLW